MAHLQLQPLAAPARLGLPAAAAPLADPPCCLLPPGLACSPLQGDAREGLGRAEAKGEDVAEDANRAARAAADRLKP